MKTKEWKQISKDMFKVLLFIFGFGLVIFAKPIEIKLFGLVFITLSLN